MTNVVAHLGIAVLGLGTFLFSVCRDMWQPGVTQQMLSPYLESNPTLNAKYSPLEMFSYQREQKKKNKAKQKQLGSWMDNQTFFGF